MNADIDRRMLSAIEIEGVRLPEQRRPLEHLFFLAIFAEPFGVFYVVSRILWSVILRGAAASVAGVASPGQAPSVVDTTDTRRLRPQHRLYGMRIVVLAEGEGCVGHDDDVQQSDDTQQMSRVGWVRVHYETRTRCNGLR